MAAQSSFAGHGDRHGELGVLGATHPGGYGALCAVSADHVHLMPADLSFVAAAVFPTAWMTTHHALFRVGKLQAGETLLLHGATSALTLAATQLAVALGAEVLVTAATEEKCAVATALGASATAVNRGADVTAWVMQQTDGKGVDMVLDHVGPALWETSLFALAPSRALGNLRQHHRRQRQHSRLWVSYFSAVLKLRAVMPISQRTSRRFGPVTARESASLSSARRFTDNIP